MRVQNRFDSKKIGEMVIMSNGEIGVSCVEATYGYDSLFEFLSEGWEDYKPQEPCIENKEVRKVVRVWAEVCGVKEAVFYLFGRESDFWDNDNNNVSISFNFPLRLEDGRVYTIPELCGESES